ncbi:hypothetical protein [Microbulbifer sp. TRSA007]|uniref:hypothetical protein n=1 Tax=Microbulbifer sp. TRSA007 TaxID=3243384 RepID=UPI0040398435
MQVYEFGDYQGIPVIFFMGTPQKGESGHEFSELASKVGIRLICPTRAWYGEFDSAPSFDKCSEKTSAYLQNNEIRKCHVISGSGGGPFVLHFSTVYCARKILASRSKIVSAAKSVASIGLTNAR